jgi:hypothetical protein
MRRKFLTVARGLEPEEFTVATARREWTRLRPLIGWLRQHIAPDA